MSSVLIKFRFKKAIDQQRGVACNEMTYNMVTFADIGRPGAKVGFQDTETILNLVSACANIKDSGSILVFSAVKVGSNGIVTIVFFFFLNNRLVNIVVMGSSKSSTSCSSYISFKMLFKPAMVLSETMFSVPSFRQIIASISFSAVSAVTTNSQYSTFPSVDTAVWRLMTDAIHG